MSTTAILLAAGESTRMGEPKALLPWGEPGAETALVQYQVDQLRRSHCAEVVVVLGHAAERLAATLAPLPAPGDGAPVRLVVNPGYRSGKVGSLLAGLAAVSPAATAVLVLGVDQPRPAWLVDRVIEARAAAAAPVAVPGHAGRRGHPAVFAAALLPELRRISEQGQGLREVLSRHAGEMLLVEVGSPLALVDLNRPEDYAAARALSWLDDGRPAAG